MEKGDIVLIDLREFQKDKGDVVQRYNADEARHLKKIGHLPENIQIENNENQPSTDVPFEFTMGGGDGDEAEENSVEEQDTRRGQMLPEYSDSDEDLNETENGVNKGEIEVGKFHSFHLFCFHLIDNDTITSLHSFLSSQ
jgi:hypothetical protein